MKDYEIKRYREFITENKIKDLPALLSGIAAGNENGAIIAFNHFYDYVVTKEKAIKSSITKREYYDPYDESLTDEWGD